MEKYLIRPLKQILLHTLPAILFCCVGAESFATAWTTGTPGNVNNLTNWTNGSSSPTSFTTPGDTWAITLPMYMPASAVWTVGTVSTTPATVTFAAGGSITDTAMAAAPVIYVYGNLVGNGGDCNITGASTAPVINVYGNAIISAGSFTASGNGAHLTFNVHGNFIMTGGSVSVTGNAGNNRLNFYGNCSLSGGAAFLASGAGTSGSVHFAHPASTGVGLIDNSDTATWPGMDVYVDSGCAAQLDGNFTTSTGTVAKGLTVNGTLICPETDSVNGAHNFNLNAGGTLIVAHPAGINGAIVSTGMKNFSDSASYGFNGIAAQVTGSYLPATLYAPDTIIINNGAGVTLSHSVTSTGVLAFTNGILHTGINTITLPGAAASVAGAGAGRYVFGPLIKTIDGDTVVNFETGDMNYAPLSLKFDTAGTGGSIGVTVYNGLHPSAGSSGLSTSQMVNHYWTVADNSASGPGKVRVGATYALSDILGGSNAYFVTQRYDGASWLTYPLPTANTTSPCTSATDSGIVLGALHGDYIFGRGNGTLGVTGTAGNALELRVFPNPNDGTFAMILISENDEQADVLVNNLIGETVKTFSAVTNKEIHVSLDVPPGMYLLSVSTAHSCYWDRVIVK